MVIRFLLFPTGSIRTIRFRPMKGMVFRVNSITGLSPWYSGVERRHQRLFKKLVQPGDIIVDIGANWGGAHPVFFTPRRTKWASYRHGALPSGVR